MPQIEPQVVPDHHPAGEAAEQRARDLPEGGGPRGEQGRHPVDLERVGHAGRAHHRVQPHARLPAWVDEHHSHLHDAVLARHEPGGLHVDDGVGSAIQLHPDLQPAA